jgi:uncharacterized membrane protein YdfJ with MMPL/SSD domain
VLSVIAAITFVLLFLLTGSVVLPLKALLLNLLSLTATLGALVWIFQDGHLGALGTTPTGTLTANMPVLLFCIAFGLSIDYEVFLVSRIREYWLGWDRVEPRPADPQCKPPPDGLGGARLFGQVQDRHNGTRPRSYRRPRPCCSSESGARSANHMITFRA